MAHVLILVDKKADLEKESDLKVYHAVSMPHEPTHIDYIKAFQYINNWEFRQNLLQNCNMKLSDLMFVPCPKEDIEKIEAWIQEEINK